MSDSRPQPSVPCAAEAEESSTLALGCGARKIERKRVLSLPPRPCDELTIGAQPAFVCAKGKLELQQRAIKCCGNGGYAAWRDVEVVEGRPQRAVTRINDFN